jgi:oxidase EvaA
MGNPRGAQIFISEEVELTEWLDAVRADVVFHVEPLPVAESREWIYSATGAVHRSGGFFRVRGCVDEEGRAQPLLDQREVGLLGNVVCTHRGQRWVLLQAKAEPGTVGKVQLTCTVQATRSNRRQRHCGTRPRFEELFRPGRVRVLHHSLETEQGSRFLGKWNADWTVEVVGPGALGELGPLYRWVKLDLVARTLNEPYVYTTDFRSVLACCPWPALFPDLAGADTPLARSVREPSLEAGVGREWTRSLAKWRMPRLVPLGELRGWTLDRFGLTATGAGAAYDVPHFRIHISDRENEHWDQPLIRSKGAGTVILLVRLRRGALELALSPRDELGLVRRRQLTTPYLAEPGAPANPALDAVRQVSRLLSSCSQSEEGGRFYQERNLYEVRLLDGGAPPGPEPSWFRLADVQALRGAVDNEARSAISLLAGLGAWRGQALIAATPAAGRRAACPASPSS